MSSILRIKRRVATGAAGAPSSLASGELAYNENDNTTYYGFGDNGSGVATSIIPIGGKGAFLDLSSAQTIAGVKTFSVSPQVPTATAGDNSANAASTAFVTAAVGNAGGSQAANTVYSGPSSGGNAAPTFRSLVAADIPSIPSSKLSDLGAANGAASLDGSGKVPVSQLPASVLGSLKFVSTLAASGSLPASPTAGQYWIISSAGTFTGTSHALKVGDWIVYDGNAGGDLATGWDYIDNSVQVSSVFGRTGVITAQSGDYNSDQVTEGSTNLFFTAARVLATVLTGLSTATATAVAATDSILVAIGKLQAQVSARLVAANNLSDLASASTARINLGLGSMATQNASAVAITGGTVDGVTISGGTY